VTASATSLPHERFLRFSVLQLLRGAPIYEFQDFYRVKNALLCYDERDAYLNYGLWDRGGETTNPSAALVARLVDALPDAGWVLDVGSGIGQPAVDLAHLRPGVQVVGVNRSARQVEVANERARAAGLSPRVSHRALDAAALDTLPERFAGAMAVESLAEMPQIAAVLAGIADRLIPGGRLVLCDVVVCEAPRGLAARLLGGAMVRTTKLLYGDHWRSMADYERLLDEAGFDEVEVESIGAEVYAPTWDHARSRLGGLLRATRRPLLAAALATLNLWTLAALHRRGLIDYTILRARRR
jgi:cyclopropane fatty-acyl-phospholipid synthase-like methyltransferase